MKCMKCGTQISEGDHFCHKCGAKIPEDAPKIRFCRECGIQLNEGVNYCPKCGAKVPFVEDTPLEQFQEADTNEESENGVEDAWTPDDVVSNDPLWSVSGLKERAVHFWNKLDWFLKCSAIILTIDALLLFVSICTAKSGAEFCAVLAIGCTLTAVLMHKNIIKAERTWLKYVLVLVSVLWFLFGMSCYTDKKTQPVETQSQAVYETTAEMVDNTITVPFDSSEFYGEPLNNVEATLRAAGFSNIHAKENTVASTNYLKAEDTVSSVTVDGIEDFERGQLFSKEAPVVIYYLKAQDEKNIVNLYIDFSENLFFSTYGVTLTIDDYTLGTLPHGTSQKFELNLDAGSYILEAKKSDNPAVGGRIELNIYETSDITVHLACHSDSVSLTQTYYESKRELQENEARVPQSANSYDGKIYSEVVSELRSAGFSDISTAVIRDITGAWLDPKEGEIESITIGGKADFIKSEVFLKNDPVIIKYHTQAYTQQEMQEKIWASVDTPASEIVSYFEETPCRVECFILGRKIDSFTPDGYFLESGTVSDDGKTVVLNFTNPELTEMRQTLENDFPQDMAIRVVVTAMTNGQATDVFKSDGMTYDTKKFHKYSDISGFYLYPYEIGTWIVESTSTWRVEGMKCMLSGYKTAINVSANITLDGKNYVLSNVDKIIAGKEYIDSGNTGDFITEHYDDPDENPFLVVPVSLVNKDRDVKAEQERNNRTMPTTTREKWIENQFNWFTGRHDQFEKLIKERLNDEKSFKESKTTYVDIINEDTLKEINNILQRNGYSNRCKMGDLFIVCDFTAKNAFNATIKYSAIGISSYDTNKITLVGIG